MDDGSCLAFFEAPDRPFEFKEQHDFDLHIALEVSRQTLESMLAKAKLGFPSFAVVKTILWLVVGMMPVIARKAKLSAHGTIIVSLVLVGVLAWLGLTKPVFW
jgi:hypothetical protein